MYKAFKYRIYPNKAQTEMINKHFGCCRFVYNWALERKTTAYQTSRTRLSCFDLQKELTKLKKDDKYLWLQEINAQSIAQSISHLDFAFSRFFKEKKGYPKFKKKRNQQSFTARQGCKVDFDSGKISIPKILGIKAKLSRTFSGDIKLVTISRTASGKYFASFIVETGQPLPAKPKPREKKAVGIDLGLTSFCTLSTGEKVASPKFLKQSIKKLRKIQRQFSRKIKSSNRREKARLRVARLHERVSNQRMDFLHKLSTQIVRENQTVCVENLDIQGMLKTPWLAREISDAGWAKLIELLKYKCDWYGKNLLQIGRFEPSSKMCSCGIINNSLKLADRQWTCEHCGKTHDRDILAAQNIKRFAFVDQNLIGQVPLGQRKLKARGDRDVSVAEPRSLVV